MVLLFLHFCLCCSTDTDDRYAACKFCKTFLKLFFIKVRLCIFDLSLYLSNSVSDSILAAFAADYDCVLFLDLDALRAAKLFDLSILEFKADLRTDDLSACKDCDIFEHCFSSVAISGSFDCYYIECTTQLVDDKCCKSFAINIFCDDEERSALLYDIFK